MKKNKFLISIDNLEKAVAELFKYVQEPIESPRDQAGVIQGFEFNFELFWKTFKKIAEGEGLQIGGPKSALKAALQMGLIQPEKETTWLTMLDDRNLASHIYHQEISSEICQRIQKSYLKEFEATLHRLKEMNGTR